MHIAYIWKHDGANRNFHIGFLSAHCVSIHLRVSTSLFLSLLKKIEGRFLNFSWNSKAISTQLILEQNFVKSIFQLLTSLLLALKALWTFEKLVIRKLSRFYSRLGWE